MVAQKIGDRCFPKLTLRCDRIYIKRDGLDRTRLIPILIDTQEIGDSGEQSFLTTVSERMAQAVGMEAPVLNAAPYLAFQHFLIETQAILDNQRFLLMIDEAEPIFQGKFGAELPPFLRSLMQHADYPTLLLFILWDLFSQTSGVGLFLGVFQYRRI